MKSRIVPQKMNVMENSKTMPNTILTFNISGKSILELREQYGTGNGGFYDQNWYLSEDFAKDKPKAGTYEINFGEDTKSLIFREQKEKIEKRFEVAHPAVILEAVCQHYAKTKEYLLGDYWVRTSLLGSDGRRVSVGYCGAGGVSVSDYWGGGRGGGIGVGASRKFDGKFDLGNLDPLASLELRISKLEKAVFGKKKTKK